MLFRRHDRWRSLHTLVYMGMHTRAREVVERYYASFPANKRVHLFETTNGQPSDLVKELDAIVKSIALNDKNAPIKFIPVNRINTIIAIAPRKAATQRSRSAPSSVAMRCASECSSFDRSS